MPAILCLLFLSVPIFAALSLDFGVFVPFLILFCVAAGLSVPSVEKPSDVSVEKRRCGDRAPGFSGF